MPDTNLITLSLNAPRPVRRAGCEEQTWLLRLEQDACTRGMFLVHSERHNKCPRSLLAQALGACRST